MLCNLNIFLSIATLLLCRRVANGLVTLDTSADLTGWKISGCAYADGYEDNEFAPCRVDVAEDGELNSGYWSFCDSLSSCRLTYTMGDETITAIRIRSFVVPNAGGTSPVTKITYRNYDGPNMFKNFPAEAEGWELIEFMFEEYLRAGATIEVSQTGFYNNGMDIALVDKIILSDGLGPLPTTTTTEPTRTTTTQGTTSTTTMNHPTTFLSSPPTTTEGGSISCPPEGIIFLPHPTDCAKFYICAEGESFPSECAPGLLFDPDIGQCNIASEVHCEIHPECPEEDGISFLPIIGTCQKYIVCVSGEGTEFECADGTEFSPEAEKCVLAYEYDCPYTRAVLPAFQCPSWFIPPRK